jgi:acyl-CoA synthetase (AMP-forming)/AMP-acid ligase II
MRASSGVSYVHGASETPLIGETISSCLARQVAAHGDQDAIDDVIDRRVSTVGRVHPHVECKIVDAETGRVLPRGVAGELCTRGYSVMLGYWSDAEATAAAIDPAGWMHTGDLAIMDAKGRTRFRGTFVSRPNFRRPSPEKSRNSECAKSPLKNSGSPLNARCTASGR